MVTSMLKIGVLILALSTAVLGERCPSFSNAKSSCTSNTCGHFVYKGTFVDSIAKKYRLSDVIEGIVLNPETSSPATCCNLCRQADTCAYWSYVASSGFCSLFEEGLCQGTNSELTSVSSTAGNPAVYNPKENGTYVGGFCLKKGSKSFPSLSTDLPKEIEEKSFCLVSDKSLHINMLLGGYFDHRTTGATSVRNGMAIRTWIREVGIIWSMNGKTHTLHVGARRGPERRRQDGYVDFIYVDGTAIPRLALGDELNLFDGQAVVSFEAYEKTGPYDVDVFKVKIEGLLEAEMRLRIAHPLLQLENDAEVHINMDILDLDYTNSVHGVLGQTYRADRLDQALNYAALSDLVFGVTGGEGAATTIDSLDGTVGSYVSSSITSPDCAFSQFNHVQQQNKRRDVVDKKADDETVKTLNVASS